MSPEDGAVALEADARATTASRCPHAEEELYRRRPRPAQAALFDVRAEDFTDVVVWKPVKKERGNRRLEAKSATFGPRPTSPTKLRGQTVFDPSGTRFRAPNARRAGQKPRQPLAHDLSPPSRRPGGAQLRGYSCPLDGRPLHSLRSAPLRSKGWVRKSALLRSVLIDWHLEGAGSQRASQRMATESPSSLKTVLAGLCIVVSRARADYDREDCQGGDYVARQGAGSVSKKTSLPGPRMRSKMRRPGLVIITEQQFAVLSRPGNDKL